MIDTGSVYGTRLVFHPPSMIRIVGVWQAQDSLEFQRQYTPIYPTAVLSAIVDTNATQVDFLVPLL